MLSREHEALLGLGYVDLALRGPLLRMSSWHIAVSWAMLPHAERKLLWAWCQSPAKNPSLVLDN